MKEQINELTVSTSGAMNRTVPTKTARGGFVLGWVESLDSSGGMVDDNDGDDDDDDIEDDDDEGDVSEGELGPTHSPKLKSEIRNSIRSVRRICSAFRSRWITPLAWHPSRP